MDEDLFGPVRQRRFAAPLGWQPPADVFETPRGWLVKFELAGVRDEEVSVTVSGRYLLLQGRRADVDRQHGCRFHSLEIAYSRFSRVVELPEPVEGARLFTDFRRGMFLVFIQREETGP